MMRPPSPSVADATASSAWKRSSAVGPFRRTVTTATPSASRFPAYRPFIIAGEARHCLPGQCHILHPDDWRDGAPGNDEGIAYRIVYIDPSLIQAALNGQALPFVPDLVIDLTDAQRRAMTVAWHLDAPIDDTSRVEITTVVTELLLANRAAAPARVAPLALSGLLRARSLIAECPARRHGIGELSASPTSIAGRSRGSFVRHSAPARRGFAP